MRTPAALRSAVISFAESREARPPGLAPAGGQLGEGSPKARRLSYQFLMRHGCGLIPVPDQAALLRCIPGPDRPPWAIHPSRAPPVGIPVVLGEADPPQRLATFGIEPSEAGCRRRTVDPRRQVERRTVGPRPEVAAKGRRAGQAGALLYATAVSLLGNSSHQLQHVSLVAIREVEEPPAAETLGHLTHGTASSCQHQVPAMLVSIACAGSPLRDHRG